MNFNLYFLAFTAKHKTQLVIQLLFSQRIQIHHKRTFEAIKILNSRINFQINLSFIYILAPFLLFSVKYFTSLETYSLKISIFFQLVNKSFQASYNFPFLTFLCRPNNQPNVLDTFFFLMVNINCNETVFFFPNDLEGKGFAFKLDHS